MKKIYHLGTCSTNKAIIREMEFDQKGFEMQDIKLNPITASQLDEMKRLAGSYEALFSRRSMKYKEWGLKDRRLEEKDFRELILQEYTFLKRPVVIIGNKIFAGSDKQNLEALKKAL